MLSYPLHLAHRHLRVLVQGTLLVLLISAAATVIAVHFTPQQHIGAYGQNATVGAYTSLSPSGPAKLDMFGAHDTSRPHVAGIFLPVFVMPSFDPSNQSGAYTRLFDTDQFEQSLFDKLEHAWFRYYVELDLFAVILCVAVGSAIGGLCTLAGGFRIRREAAKMLLICTAAAAALNFAVVSGSILSTRIGMDALVRNIDSPTQLIGEASMPRVSEVRPVARGNIVVIGDSTAAGYGNAPLPHPTKIDALCGRSIDSFAQDLARPGNWKVSNFACMGATIPQGLQGPQFIEDHRVTPQFDQLEAVKDPVAIIVDVGADDMHWQLDVGLCILDCTTKLTSNYYHQNLQQFQPNLAKLFVWLKQFQSEQKHQPLVLINLYYNPLSSDVSCLPDYVGANEDAHQVEQDRQRMVDTLTGQLDHFNDQVAKMADNFGFVPVDQNFDGHQLCDTQPYVQQIGKSAGALHPNASGEQTIATADSQALEGLIRPSEAGSSATE
jgi:lysophospholipase L1-like esterase